MKCDAPLISIPVTSTALQQQLVVFGAVIYGIIVEPRADYHGYHILPDVQSTRQRFLMVQAAVTPVRVFPAPEGVGGRKTSCVLLFNA